MRVVSLMCPKEKPLLQQENEAVGVSIVRIPLAEKWREIKQRALREAGSRALENDHKAERGREDSVGVLNTVGNAVIHQ